MPLPGPNVSPRAEGHQPPCSPVRKLSMAVVTASAVGATGGEAAAAASDSFHKCSVTVHGGFWMPDKKQCWTCESYTDGQILALDLQNVLFKKLSQIGQPKQVIFLAIWSFSSSPNWAVRTVCVMFCRSKVLGWYSDTNAWDKGVRVPPFHMKKILLTLKKKWKFFHWLVRWIMNFKF